jgi:hypothetical protein
VVAFGSSDSHDDHYFVSPDEMIRGPVIDPRLTLENPDIARRHLRAYLLQRYHEDRIPGIDPQADPNLFSVLGRVRDFRSGTGVLNREDFAGWLAENRPELEHAVDRWPPDELSRDDRARLIREMTTDVVQAVDEAIGFVGVEPEPEGDATDTENAPTEDAAPDGADEAEDQQPGGEDIDFVDPRDQTGSAMSPGESGSRARVSMSIALLPPG